MKASHYANYTQHLSQDSPMFMEPYERNHIEQVYKATKEQLVCWGEKSNYLDSEFSNVLERKAQGEFSEF
jgi:hypothetical protein